MLPALDIAGLLALLDAQQTLILPTAQAALALREHFERQQRDRGLRSWEPAQVLAWDEWTESLWSTLLLVGADDRVLLNRLQEELLWAEIIAASPEGAPLTSGASRDLAGLARSALDLAAANEAMGRLPPFADNFDAKAFVSWERRFAQHCAREHLLPRALLQSAVGEHFRRHSLAPPPSLHFAGFEHLTPAQHTLLETLQTANCAVRRYSLETAGIAASLRGSVTLPDPRQELRWAAHWLRARCTRDLTTPLTVAIILPDPASERAGLEPILREILSPELEPVGADLSSTPWVFSAGPPLASLPLIQHALLLLRWTQEALPLPSIGTLLLSPFLGHTDPFEARARFEMHGLRRATLLRPELSIPELLSLRQRKRSPTDPEVSFPELHALHRLIADRNLSKGQGWHADWTEHIRKLLRAVGWPGPRTLSPAEFRTTEAWESLLDLLATLDFSGRRLRFDDLLHLLDREAAAVPAPSAATGASVRILRLAETEGCFFDAALLLHATDDHLPAPERPHPLLGWGLQRSLGLPGTDPALGHRRSREAIEHLRARCGDLLLVAAQADENGDLRLTPLAAELEFRALAAAKLVSPAPEERVLELEAVADTSPLPALPSPQVSGGARVLELQAACGFRAFASLRLQATVPESRSLGLDPRDAGSVLHTAMELLWTELKTQAALRALGADRRHELIGRCVADALSRLRAKDAREDRWTSSYVALFEQRLGSLLARWLQHELKRGPFEVLPPEQGQSVAVGPLELHVRPDRIDKVDGGGYVFVDYKTSSALSTEDWLGERPLAPQLPLYTLLGEAEEVQGVAFARLRPGEEMTWLSLQGREHLFPQDRNNTLHELKDEVGRWREELDRLACDFAEGRTAIDPKLYPNTCKYCDQRLLCRRDAATLLAGDEKMRSETEEHNG